MPQIEISEAALAYLKKHAEPLTDTTISVLDRILREHADLSSKAIEEVTQLEMRFRGDNLPSVKFTTILSAKIAGKPASQKYWNNILEDLIAACIGRGASAADIRAVLQANVLDGNQNENGYRFVPAAGFSFQGLEANRVCKNLAMLCERFGVSVDIDIRWQDDDKAAFPNQSARIVLP